MQLNWRLNHEELRKLPIPMLADVKRELAAACGVLDRNEGVALRATFVVDPDGIIRFTAVNDGGAQSSRGAARAGCAADR